MSTKLKLSQEILDKCSDFARRSYESSKDCYTKRKQNDKSLIITQITEGKFSEWGVYQYYINKGLDCSEPDHEIYEKKRKSFSPDLRRGQYNIHVKGQNAQSYALYGNSWLFQLEDPLFSKATERDICVFCHVDINQREVTVVYRQQFKRLKFEQPKLAKFRGIKLAIYLDSQEDICS